MLCAACVGFGPGMSLAGAGDVGAGFEVVMLAEAVGAEVQVMDAALDGRFVVAALIAEPSFSLATQARTRCFSFRPEASFHVEAEGGQNHASRKQHGTGAEHDHIAWLGKRRREKA